MLISVTAFTVVFKLVCLHVTSLFLLLLKKLLCVGVFSLLANLPAPLLLIPVTEKRFSCIHIFC